MHIYWIKFVILLLRHVWSNNNIHPQEDCRRMRVLCYYVSKVFLMLAIIIISRNISENRLFILNDRWVVSWK